MSQRKQHGAKGNEEVKEKKMKVKVTKKDWKQVSGPLKKKKSCVELGY